MKAIELVPLTGGQPTQEYLRQRVLVDRMFNSGWDFSAAQWLLDNGRVFPLWSPLPKRVRRGPMKACYHNSLRLAKRGKGRYVYMEGYATHLIPVSHAWCYDREAGLVVDTTWAEGIDYVGVPLKTAYAARMLRRDREPLMNWMDKYPILTGATPVEEWREEI